MEAATAAAFAVVAPLTLSGYAHLKDCLRTSSRRVGEAPRLFKDAFADPSNQLRIVESQGNTLGGHVTLSVDGQTAGSYLVFNGEILLVGDDPSHLQAVAAIGGARVTSQAHTVSVVAWEAPREMTLEFTSEQEAVLWAKALREAAKLPQFPSRLDMLIEHIHMQDIHKKDLQVRVDKLQKDHEELLREVEENTLNNKVAELEEKLRETSSALDAQKSKGQAAEESLKEHLRLLKDSRGGVQELQVGAVYYIDSSDPQHKAEHVGLAYRRSMDLEDKDEEIARWGTTVAGIDKGNGWVQVGQRYLPKVVGEDHVLKVFDPVAESLEEELVATKSSLESALVEKEEADERLRLLSRQVQDLKDMVAWAASATGRPDLLEAVAAAEANTLGASQEHADMLTVAEARKAEIEEHARTLEGRLLSLEQRHLSSAGQLGKQHLEKLEAAEEKHRLLSRQVQDIKEAVTRTATAGGHQELLEVLAAAEANTLGASREHADMLESAEARKIELEERAHILEQRLLRLEQGPEPLAEQLAKQDRPAGFELDADEHADFAKMIEMAEAKRSQLEEQARELEMRIAAHEQPQEHKRSVEHAALTAKIQELQSHHSEKDRQIDEHLGRLEQEKREELASLAARLGQTEALLSQKEQHVEELLAELANAKPSNGGVGAVHGPSDEDLQALVLHVAEAQGKAIAQAAHIHSAAEVFEQHAKELEELRYRDGAAPHEVTVVEAGRTESMRGELERLRMDVVAATQAAKAAEVEKQACIAQMTDMEVELRELQQSANIRESQNVQIQANSPELVQALQRIAEAEARTRQLQDAVEDKDRLVTELFTSVAEREQDIAKLQEALAQQPEVAVATQGLPDEVVQELEQRTLSAEARVGELSSIIQEKDSQAVQLSSTVTALEQEVVRLRMATMSAGDTQELLQRAADAEAHAADLRAAYEDREAEKVQLVAQVTAMEQEIMQLQSQVTGGQEVQSRGFSQPEELEELTQRAVVAEARATEFEELAARSQDELARLKATVAGSEQALHQRAVVAEQQLADLHAITGERDQQFTQLREELKATKQELSHQTMTATSREVQLQAAATAAEQRVEQLKQHIELAEQEMAALRSNHADKADAFEAELQRFKDVETNSREAEALIQERDGHILQLRQDMGGLKEELSRLRLQQAHSEEVAKQNLLKQTSIAQAHMRTAEDAEAKAAQFKVLVDEKANRIEQLQASTGQLLEELTQLRAAAAERAEMDKAGKQAFLQEARAAEDLIRGQGFQESVDEVRAREAERTKQFEEDKIILQRQLEAQFDVEYSAIQNQAAQVQKGLEATSLERDALLTQLEQVQAQESQRAKFFEEEKANLRRHLAEQFETEYTVIQKKATDAEAKLHATAMERDALKISLQKAELAAATRRDSPVKEQEPPPAVLQRLAASETAAEEARAKLQVAEQELIVACRTIEKQSYECGELQSQKRQEASAWEMKVAQLEQDRLLLQEQLAQRTMAYNRELEDVGVKMKLLEEALISAGGVAEAHTQARAELSPTNTSPKAAEAWEGTPKSIESALPRWLLGDGPPTPQSAPLGQTIPIIQVASPSQAYRVQETPLHVGATAPQAGFVGQVSQQPPFAAPFGSAPNVLSPPLQTTLTPVPSYVAPPVTTAPALPAAAPFQNLVVPTGLVSPMQARPQDPRGAAQMFGFAARPVQLVSPMVSPIRQRQDPPPPPPLATAAVAVMQRGASPPLRRAVQSAVAPVVAAVPMNRASLTTATPVPASAVAPSLGALHPSVRGSYSHRSRVETPVPDTSARPVRQEGVSRGWSSMPTYEPGSVGQVPMAKAVRSESGSMLTSNLLQPPELAHFQPVQPAVAPSGGIITSASSMAHMGANPTESNIQSSLRLDASTAWSSWSTSGHLQETVSVCPVGWNALNVGH